MPGSVFSVFTDMLIYEQKSINYNMFWVITCQLAVELLPFLFESVLCLIIIYEVFSKNSRGGLITVIRGLFDVCEGNLMTKRVGERLSKVLIISRPKKQME